MLNRMNIGGAIHIAHASILSQTAWICAWTGGSVYIWSIKKIKISYMYTIGIRVYFIIVVERNFQIFMITNITWIWWRFSSSSCKCCSSASSKRAIAANFLVSKSLVSLSKSDVMDASMPSKNAAFRFYMYCIR